MPPEFVATALAEKMSILTTETYLLERAKLGSKKKFKHVLSKVQSNEADDHDMLSDSITKAASGRADAMRCYLQKDYLKMCAPVSR